MKYSAVKKSVGWMICWSTEQSEGQIQHEPADTAEGAWREATIYLAERMSEISYSSSVFE